MSKQVSKCAACSYSINMPSGQAGSKISCGYIIKTGKRRGCSATECDKYTRDHIPDMKDRKTMKKTCTTCRHAIPNDKNEAVCEIDIKRIVTTPEGPTEDYLWCGNKFWKKEIAEEIEE